MRCEMKTPDGYCRIDNRGCSNEPKEVKNRVVDGILFVELQYPKDCPMKSYLNLTRPTLANSPECAKIWKEEIVDKIEVGEMKIES